MPEGIKNFNKTHWKEEKKLKNIWIFTKFNFGEAFYQDYIWDFSLERAFQIRKRHIKRFLREKKTYILNASTYFTLNGFTKEGRRRENLRALRSFIIDIDFDHSKTWKCLNREFLKVVNGWKNRVLTIPIRQYFYDEKLGGWCWERRNVLSRGKFPIGKAVDVIFSRWVYVNREDFPRPTWAVFTGRGLSLIWLYEDVPATERVKALWERSAENLLKIFGDLNPDRATTKNPTAGVRLPHTKNWQRRVRWVKVGRVYKFNELISAIRRFVRGRKKDFESRIRFWRWLYENMHPEWYSLRFCAWGVAKKLGISRRTFFRILDEFKKLGLFEEYRSIILRDSKGRIRGKDIEVKFSSSFFEFPDLLQEYLELWHSSHSAKIPIYIKRDGGGGFSQSYNIKGNISTSKHRNGHSGDLREFLRRVDWERVFEVKGKGRNYIYGLCPIHPERNPSFAVYFNPDGSVIPYCFHERRVILRDLKQKSILADFCFKPQSLGKPPDI